MLQVALVQADRVLGIATLSWLESVDWWFLEYFAIAEGHRDAGLREALARG